MTEQTGKREHPGVKPLELQTLERLWQPLLRDLTRELTAIGTDLQVWYPVGDRWAGRSDRNRLPPTALPAPLGRAGGQSFAGRQWWLVTVIGHPWLISLKAPQPPATLPLTVSTRDRLETMARLLRLEGLLQLLVTTLESVVSEEPGHWNRVRHLAVALGLELGFDDEALFELEIAALVHDVGKAQLPGELLRRTGPLDPAERQQLASHSLLGATMIRSIPGMQRVAELVAAHHECPDGTGYPYGLREPSIPLAGLVIAVADAFDAMTHHRPYADPHTYRQTVLELTEPAGRFSPTVLDALTRLLASWGMLDVIPPRSSDAPPPADAGELPQAP